MLTAIGRLSILGILLLFAFFPHPTLAQFAPGVLQSAAQTATITGSVTQSDGTPVMGANVQLSGPGAHLTTQSDAHGTFAFLSVPYGVYTLVATAARFGAATRDLVLKGDIAVTIQYVAQSGELKTIARVSTSSAGAQINVTPASIASVTPSEYAFQGNSSWRQLLDQIPGVTAGGDLGSGEFDEDSVPGNPFTPVILSINGALPYETSVTLDGMPLTNASLQHCAGGNGTDLAYLPMPTFDTADVVRGPGANAPSIVDSIGGSFVLHAPGQVDKNSFEFSLSNDPYGGIVSNVKMALRFGKLSTTVVYGINNSPGPLGSQNVVSALTIKPLTVNGNPFLGCTPSACSNQVQVPGYQGCACNFDDTLLMSGIPVSTAWTQHNGSIAFSYAFTPSISAQVFYTGSSSAMQAPLSKYPVDFMPGPSYTGSITPGIHYYRSAEGPESLAEASSLLEEKITAYVGHGVLRLAAMQNKSFDTYALPDFFPNGQYTLYGTGNYGPSPGTPVVFNGTSAYLTFPSIVYTIDNAVYNRALLASYTDQIGPRSSLGVSYVSSYYNEPTQFDYNGYIFGVISPAVSETTNELRFYASTEISDKLSLNASWYSAQGSYHVVDPLNQNAWTNTVFPYSAPRLGAVWHASRDIVIRAAAGGGYALPPLGDLVGSTATYFCGPFYATYATNLNLRPETSFGFDVGTDIRLHYNTVLSFDLYRTNLYGQIFQSENQTGTFAGLPLYTIQYENLTQSRYEGITLDIRHDVPKGIYWHGALGLTRAYAVSVPPGFYDSSSGPNTVNTYIVPNINFDGWYQSTVPYANGSAQIGYRWTPNKYIELSPTYYGKNNPYYEPAFLEFDAHAGYPLTKNVSLLATFRNITGIYDQNYQLLTPSMGAPTVTGLPFALVGIPYGPRTVIVTLNFKT